MKFYQIAKLVQFNFTEVTQFLWNSFGPNIKAFDFECPSLISDSNLFGTIYVNHKGDVLYGNISITHSDSYLSHMWVHPEFIQPFIKEHEDRGFPFNNEQAIILDSSQDFISKLKEHTESPEGNITVELDDDVILYITKAAHEQDITFNDMVNQILETHMKELVKQKQQAQLITQDQIISEQNYTNPSS